MMIFPAFGRTLEADSDLGLTLPGYGIKNDNIHI
jgi:hypothetical protein